MSIFPLPHQKKSDWMYDNIASSQNPGFSDAIVDGERTKWKQKLLGETSSKALSKWVDFPSSCLAFVGLFFSSCLQLEQDIRCGAAIMWKQGNKHRWAEKCKKPGPLCWFPRAPITKNLTTKWLKTMETYSLTALEVRGLKSRFQKAMLPSEPLGEDPSLPLLVSGGPRCSLAYDSINSLWAFIFLWPSSSVPLPTYPSCKSTRPQLDNICKDAFSKQGHSHKLGLQHLWGDIIQPTPVPMAFWSCFTSSGFSPSELMIWGK